MQVLNKIGKFCFYSVIKQKLTIELVWDYKITFIYRIQFVEDVKDVYDSYELLSNWLSAKERMFAALGPISPDPRMVQVD